MTWWVGGPDVSVGVGAGVEQVKGVREGFERGSDEWAGVVGGGDGWPGFGASG